MMVSVTSELENYVLDEELGRGDLTIAYQGHRKEDGKIVAIKVVAPQFLFDEFFVQRFKDITRQTLKLEHPNIVRTYEVDQEENTLYVVREFIDAQPLSKIIKEEGPLPPQRMLTIARQIAAALDYAHQKSIMHGDLSAKRVYIGPDDHVTVADFGQTQAMVGTSLVKQGYAIGAPETLAPERVKGQGPSRYSDLYSLGVLCYQMLSGHPPFTGEVAAVLHAQAYEQPRLLNSVNSDISIPLSEAVGRMLSKGLELRYTTGAEFTRALTVAIEGSAPARATTNVKPQLTGLEQAPISIFSQPWLWGILVILLVLFLLAAGFVTVSAWVAWQSNASTSAPPPAVAQPQADNGDSRDIAAQQETQPEQESAQVVLVQLTPTLSPTTEALPTATATPSATSTPVPIPTPGPPVIEPNSPFTNLRLGHAISDNGELEQVGMYFAPNDDPVYLFFDYGQIEAGTTWSHRWTWGDTELDVYEDVWPNSYSETGTAWVFYGPSGGFQPGPYKVTLEVDGEVVGTATFVVEEGGL
ncbi:MAG: protein kinase [Anaerolineae bacterium]|nr:protein kinase [Anaerolineae bacterium]